MVRSSLYLLVAASLLPATSFGQSLEITPMAGARVGGTFRSGTFQQISLADPEIRAGFAGGLHLGYFISEFAQLEAFAYRQDSKFIATDASTGESVEEPLIVDQYQFGGVFHWGMGYDRARWFMSLNGGATRFDLKNGEENTRFSFGFGGGVKIYQNRRIGWRVQGRYTSTYISANDAVLCGALGCYQSQLKNYLSQLEFSGGVIIRL